MLNRTHRTVLVCECVCLFGGSTRPDASVSRALAEMDPAVMNQSYHRNIDKCSPRRIATGDQKKKKPRTWGEGHAIFSSPASSPDFGNISVVSVRQYHVVGCTSTSGRVLTLEELVCACSPSGLRGFFLCPKGHVPRSTVSGITLVSPPQGIKGNAKTPKQCHCRIDQLGKKH